MISDDTTQENEPANFGKVSVIIPVFNAEKFLGRVMGSVLQQSYRNLEIILVDDGSSDKSVDSCYAYASTDSRIKVVSRANGGPAAARNTGVANSTGEYIFFLDADDMIEPQTIEILVAAYKRFRPELVICNFSKIEANGLKIEQEITFKQGEQSFHGQLKEMTFESISDFVVHFLFNPSNHLASYCWARLYRADIIKKYSISADGSMRLFEDYVFNLEYFQHIRKAIFINQPLYVYIMQNSQMSASMGIMDTTSLLHDMEIFRDKTIDFFSFSTNQREDLAKIKKGIGHALSHYSIIFMIRACRFLNRDNYQKVYRAIHDLLYSQIFQSSLKYYHVKGKDSRIIPLFAHLRMTKLLMWVCRWKAYKRYGQPQVS